MGKKRYSKKQYIDVNRWLIMVIEYYCAFANKSSSEVYPKLIEKNVIEFLEEYYDLLHGTSTSYMNHRIKDLLRE